jgi:phosphatidyl-myo-inositol dimannoside synthase
MTPSRCAILGVFSGLDSVGGIEASGRTACGVLREWGGDRAQFLCYGRPGPHIPAVQARSKAAAVSIALRRKWTVNVVLFWHIGLLKLLPLLRVGSAKVVLFLHGTEAWQRCNPLVRQLLNSVDLFLTNSNHTWKQFLTLHPEYESAAHQTVHLGCGQPVSTTESAPDARPTAVMLGRIQRSESYKGHHEVLRAWPYVLRTLPDARLWVIGPGDGGDGLRELASAGGLGDSVEILGFVTDEEKELRLRRSRALVLPSRAEGFGLVYLESMRLGRPCVVGLNDAGCEVVGPEEGGIAADPANEVALSDAIFRVLTPGPAWDGFSTRARQRYESTFTERHFAERLRGALGMCA